jgi:hypothetical protein
VLKEIQIEVHTTKGMPLTEALEQARAVNDLNHPGGRLRASVHVTNEVPTNDGGRKGALYTGGTPRAEVVVFFRSSQITPKDED